MPELRIGLAAVLALGVALAVCAIALGVALALVALAVTSGWVGATILAAVTLAARRRLSRKVRGEHS